MPKFDPMQFQNEDNKPSYEDRPKRITAGKKICVPVGAKFKTRNGKNILEVGHIVINDLESKGEEGLIHVDQFYLTHKALFVLSNFVVALGFRDPFDYENMNDIMKILLLGPFEAVFEDQTYNGSTYAKIRYYNSTAVERSEDGEPCFSSSEAKTITSGENSWDKILQYRMQNDKYGQYVEAFTASDDEEIPF
jgi:hypothetical protein